MTMSKIASNAFDILALADVEYREVTVPESGFGDWGGMTFRLRSITAGEREELLSTSVTIDGDARRISTPLMRVRIVCLAVVDEDGHRVFKNNHLAQIGSKNPKAIDLLADVAMRLAGITDDTDDDDPKPPSSTTTSDSSSS
jgi:hypothetical protein